MPKHPRVRHPEPAAPEQHPVHVGRVLAPPPGFVTTGLLGPAVPAPVPPPPPPVLITCADLKAER